MSCYVTQHAIQMQEWECCYHSAFYFYFYFAFYYELEKEGMAGPLRRELGTSMSTAWESFNPVIFKVNSTVRISACGPKGVTKARERYQENFAQNTGFRLPYNQNILFEFVSTLESLQNNGTNQMLISPAKFKWRFENLRVTSFEMDCNSHHTHFEFC